MGSADLPAIRLAARRQVVADIVYTAAHSVPLPQTTGRGRSRGSACSWTRRDCSRQLGQVSLLMSPSCGQRRAGVASLASSLELMLRTHAANRMASAGRDHRRAAPGCHHGREIQAEMARPPTGLKAAVRQKFEQDELICSAG